MSFFIHKVSTPVWDHFLYPGDMIRYIPIPDGPPDESIGYTWIILEGSAVSLVDTHTLEPYFRTNKPIGVLELFYDRSESERRFEIKNQLLCLCEVHMLWRHDGQQVEFTCLK